MVIKFYVKNVYGKENIYIADPKLANTISNLTNQKTVSKTHLNSLIALGNTIEEVLPPRAKK